MSESTITKKSNFISLALIIASLRLIVIGVSEMLNIRMDPMRSSLASSQTSGICHSRISGCSEEMPPLPP